MECKSISCSLRNFLQNKKKTVFSLIHLFEGGILEKMTNAEYESMFKWNNTKNKNEQLDGEYMENTAMHQKTTVQLQSM